MPEVEKRNSVELADLADEINAEYRAFERDFRSAAEHAIRCGEMLVEVKDSLEHGEWGTWLRENFEGSERHAQRFMKLAREQHALDPTRVSDLSLREAMRELPSGTSGKPGPSTADEIYSAYKDPPEYREWFASLTEKEKLLTLRTAHVQKYMFTYDGDDAKPSEREYRKKVMGELDRLEAEIRPIDLPADSPDRAFCEDALTYRQMHRPIAELVADGIIRRAESEEVFENFMADQRARLESEVRSRGDAGP